MTINPCRVCGDYPVIMARSGQRGVWYRLSHECPSALHSTEEAAVTAWNRDNPADDEAQAGQGGDV